MFERSVEAKGQDNNMMQNVNYTFCENVLWRLLLCTGLVELVSKSRIKISPNLAKAF